MRRRKPENYSEKDFEQEFGVTGSENPTATISSGEKKPKKSKKKKVAIIIALSLIAIILIGLISGYAFIRSKAAKVEKVEIKSEELEGDAKISQELKDYRNIAILGIDTGSNEGNGAEHSRADSIVIASINKKTKDVKLISVYRDSYLDVLENGEHVIDKVNHAHAYGGPANMINALNRNLDLNIKEFVRLDWSSIAEIVDSMGGLEVTVPDYAVGTLHLSSGGKQTLSGKQIVEFCRMRYVDSDIYRAARSREVINAAVSKAASMSIGDLNRTVDLALSEVKTNMSTSDIMGMILDVASYKMGDSIGWPYEYNGKLIGGGNLEF
ncbi:MAG: LCP family protein [Anaerovoracaceae bacterium]